MLPNREPAEREGPEAPEAPKAPEASSPTDVVEESEMTPFSFVMDGVLPIAISPKWVAYACRMAGLAKPRWIKDTGVWTTTLVGEDGVAESITIAKGRASAKEIQVKVDWQARPGERSETATARRLIATFITGMQWSLRQRSQTRMSLSLSMAAR